MTTLTQNLGRIIPFHKGNFSALTQYVELDEVFYEGSSYRAKKGVSITIGTLPTNPDFWDKVSERGVSVTGVTTEDNGNGTFDIIFALTDESTKTITTPDLTGPRGYSLNDVDITDNGNGTYDLTFTFDDAQTSTVTTPDLRGPRGYDVVNVTTEDNGDYTIDITFHFSDETSATITTPNLRGATGTIEAHVHSAAEITSGTLDIARLPAAVFQAPIVSSGDIDDLSSGQQDEILEGTHVVTTDGRVWIYSGSGSKTSEASYIELADKTPEWSVIANKPANITAWEALDPATFSTTAQIAAAYQPLSSILTNMEESFTTTLKNKLDGIESGAQVNTVTSVAGKTGAVALAATDITSGTLADALLPARLREQAATVTDWDTAIPNGVYMAADAANSPESGWLLGYTLNHGAAGWCTQTVHAFTGDSSSDTKTWRRELNNGTWGSWYRLRLSEAEQQALWDARYALTGHNHDAAYVPLARTISAGGIATGGGALSLDRTITVEAATVTELRTLTATSAAVTPAGIADASSWVSLSTGTSVAPNWQGFVNGLITASGNFTLSNPTNYSGLPGIFRTIRFASNTSSPRTLSFGNLYKIADGLTIDANTSTHEWLLSLVYNGTNIIVTGAKIKLN